MQGNPFDPSWLPTSCKELYGLLRRVDCPLVREQNAFEVDTPEDFFPVKEKWEEVVVSRLLDRQWLPPIESRQNEYPNVFLLPFANDQSNY